MKTRDLGILFNNSIPTVPTNLMIPNAFKCFSPIHQCFYLLFSCGLKCAPPIKGLRSRFSIRWEWKFLEEPAAQCIAL